MADSSLSRFGGLRKPHFVCVCLCVYVWGWGQVLCQAIGSVSVCSSSLEGISWLVAASTMGHCGSPRTNVVIQWLRTLLGFHLAYMWRLRSRQTCSDSGLSWLCPCCCPTGCMLCSFFSSCLVSFTAYCRQVFCSCWLFHILSASRGWGSTWNDLSVSSDGLAYFSSFRIYQF